MTISGKALSMAKSKLGRLTESCSYAYNVVFQYCLNSLTLVLSLPLTQRKSDPMKFNAVSRTSHRGSPSIFCRSWMICWVNVCRNTRRQMRKTVVAEELLTVSGATSGGLCMFSKAHFNISKASFEFWGRKASFCRHTTSASMIYGKGVLLHLHRGELKMERMVSYRRCRSRVAVSFHDRE